MKAEMRRSFLQGIALGRAMQGVSLHGPGQGALQLEGFPGGPPRMGAVLQKAQPVLQGGLVSAAGCMGSYTTAAMSAGEE